MARKHNPALVVPEADWSSPGCPSVFGDVFGDEEFVCTLPDGHSTPHAAYGNENDPPYCVWNETFYRRPWFEGWGATR